MDFKAGDTIITEQGQFLVVSADGFNLKDEVSEARYILISVEFGSMEGYAYDLDEIKGFYNIREVIKNKNSYERRIKGVQDII